MVHEKVTVAKNGNFKENNTINADLNSRFKTTNNITNTGGG